MAEFIPYLDLELDFMLALKALADNKETYLASRPYLDPVKWNKAYTDLMSRGITGVTLNNGSYEIQHNGLDFTDPEGYYGDVAHYILSTLAGVTPRLKEEPKKLPIFNSEEFENDFGKHVTTRYYGGNKETANAEWNLLDKPDKYGIRKTDERKARLIEALKSYKESLLNRDNEYSFEGSPFSDMNDVRARLDAAIKALESPEPDDDRKALNALGWTQDKWLETGENRSVTLSDGTEMTASLWRDMDIALNTPKTWKYFKFYKNGEYYDRFILAEKNGILKNLTKEELARFGKPYLNNPSRLKKIEGQENIYWDSIGRRVIQPSMKGVVEDLNKNSKVTLLVSQNEQPLLLLPRQLSEGLQFEDYARIGAALGDVISLGGFWANVGGSIVSLLGDTSADIADDKVSTWEAVKNLGRNLGWTAAGFIPGGKLGKVAKHIQRWGPKLLVALNDYNLLNDESNKKTWNKLTSDKLTKEGLNDEDLKNITYWIRALTGTANAAKATARDIKYSKARGTVGQEFTTKDGSKVTLSNKDVQEINVAGARKGQKAAEAKFKEKAKKATGTEHEAAEGTFKFSENGRSGLFKNTRSKLLDLQLQGKSTVFRTPEQLRYYDLLKLDRNIGGYGGWRPLNRRGTSSYFDHFDSGFSFKNPLNRITQKLDPYRNITVETPGNSQSRAQQARTNYNLKLQSNKLQATPYSNKGARREYLNTIKKHKFSNNLTQEGDFDFKLGNGDLIGFNVKKNSDGSFTISTSNIGSKVGNSKQTGSSLKVEASKVKEHFAKQIEQITKNSNNTTKHKEMARVIRELKAKGWLKHGGTINNIDTIIENFLKEQ